MTGGIDLHLHSHYSYGGVHSPAELVMQCVQKRIHMFAIADRNTVRGVGEALTFAARHNKTCFPAIEIDCTFENVPLQILGYNIDYKSPDFERIEREAHKQARAASDERLRRLAAFDLDVPRKTLWWATKGSHWPEIMPPEMLAAILLKGSRHRRNVRLAPYREDPDMLSAIAHLCRDYFSPGKPCHVVAPTPDAQAVIETIHQNGGTAVLARPGVSLAGREDMLDAIAALHLDGVEVYCAQHNAQEATQLKSRADALGLQCTGGTGLYPAN